jgi:chemotaxis protein histidine kinase CheA
MEQNEFNNIFNSFDGAAQKIINDLTKPESTPCAEILETKDKRLSSLVGIIGQLRGQVLIEIQESHLKKLYKCAYGEAVEDDMELNFYLAEFTNIIAGAGITKLNNAYKGHKLDLTPPALFAYAKMDISSSEVFSSSKIYNTINGPIRLEVSFEMNASVAPAYEITAETSLDLVNVEQTLEIIDGLYPKNDLVKNQSVANEGQASKMIVHDGVYNGNTRVPTAKVDNLVDMVGELIIIQSLLEREAVKRFDSNDNLLTNFFRMEKITKEIQNLSMSLRMVSLKSTFLKINRIGRDTMANLGKKVNLVMLGEETEIDRGITEKILDPLIHLVKNAISHGIEEESERIAKGKSTEGLVVIRAYSKQGNVYIEVADDGQGLLFEKIYQKAVANNLIGEMQNFSEEEIINLIFLPGLSTAETVDNVSGRGVGLDVVKTEITKIGGKVEVSNQQGAGCVFTLKIPVNLAVVNGTIVDIHGSRYIIPTLCIKQIVKSDEVQWISIGGNKRLIRVRDELVPVIPTKVFEIKDDSSFAGSGAGNEEQDGLFILLELEREIKAIQVRGIVERREVVVKSLGNEFSHLTFLAGASILGDGRVSLILDIENLFKLGEAV